MPVNQIRGVTLRPVADRDASEGGHALFIALEIDDPDGLIGFLEEVVTRFKAERMSGPPDLRYMLITLVGDVPAAEFASAWQASIANDAPARALLGAMHKADVVHADAPDRPSRWIDQASLLAS